MVKSKEPRRNVYVGHRYVPLIMGEWDKSIQYEGLSIVTYQGTSYTSKKRVPVGIDILNEEYWTVTGNYNAQVEEYRQEVRRMGEYVDTEVTELNKDFNDHKELITNDLNDHKTSVTNDLNDHKTEISNDLKNHKDNVNQLVSLKADKSHLELNIMDFGANGDGVNDDAPAFKNAIESLEEGGVLKVPSGDYILRDEISVPSNVKIQGEGYSTNIIGTGQFRLFKTEGSYGLDIPITNEIVRGENTANVSSVSTFKQGDHVRILGQRIATSDEDNNDNWVLGGVTSDNDKLYHGEFKQVETISNNTLTFTSGVLFPGYRPNKTQETHPSARNTTTIRKVNFIENVEISDMRFSGNFSVGVELLFALNSRVSNITWNDAPNGQIVSMRECLNCVGENLIVKFSRTNFSDTSSQAFYIVSSTGCTFRNSEVFNANTAIDITYGQRNDVNTTSQYNAIENVKVYNSKKGMTVHGGTIGIQVTDNQFINVERGIETRGRETIITGNKVIGINSTSQLAFGVHLYDGYAQDAIISNNIFKGVYVGVLLNTTNRRNFKYVGALISNNQFNSINKGIMFRDREDYNEITRSKTIISNNKFRTFYGEYAQAIMIQGNYRDFKITGNAFYGDSSNNAGVFLDWNVADVYFDDNYFENFGDYAIWVKGVKNTELHGQYNNWIVVTPSNVFDVKPRENLVQGENIEFKSQTQYGSLIPHINDRNWIGNTTERFRIIYLNRQPNVESDISVKENITPVSLGLDFIKSLKPVSYKRIDEEKTEYGLIAQDMIKTLKETGVDTTNISLVEKGENGKYGVAYSELIPIMLKAIQELNDKLK